jgi:integrase/recombinase XerD
MASDVTAIGSAGHRYPMIAAHADATRWIRSCAMFGLAGNTITAYSRAIEIFLGYCRSRSVEVRCATRELIGQYVHYLRTRPREGRGNIVRIDSQAVVSNATPQQQLTAVRLFFEFLVEEQLIQRNPVGRGRYTASKHFGRRTERGLLPRFRRLP